VIEIPLGDETLPGAGKGSLQDAFKNRPMTSKKRPNKKRAELKAKAEKANAAPFVA